MRHITNTLNLWHLLNQYKGSQYDINVCRDGQYVVAKVYRIFRVGAFSFRYKISQQSYVMANLYDQTPMAGIITSFMAGDSSVDFADYTGWVFSVFNRKDPKSDLMQAAMGLTGESCEIQENVKRFIFHNGSLDRIDMAMELGDVLFYFTLMLISNKLNLRDVMTASQTKLNVRYPNGRDGDNFVVNKNHDKEKQAVAIALNSSI